MSPIRITYKLARRLAVTLVGSTVLLLGIVMIVIPGPAVVFIPVGLAILGLEFAWARSWLKRLRETSRAAPAATFGRLSGLRDQPGNKRRGPEKPNSVIDWWAAPTRNGPRPPGVDGIKGGYAVGPMSVHF